MSHSTSYGRERRQNLSNSRLRGSDGVTVKTLPNSHSQAQSQSYTKRHQNPNLKEDQYKGLAKKEVTTESSKSTAPSSKNGANPPNPKSQGDIANSSQPDHPVVIMNKTRDNPTLLTKHSELNSERNSNNKGSRRHANAPDIEVRTHSNGRDSFSRSNSRGVIPLASTRSRSDRGSHSTSARSNVTKTPTSTSRVFISEKYRGKNDMSDYFRSSVHETTLSRLISNVAHEGFAAELYDYLKDSQNYRTIHKHGQQLWEDLLQLYSLQGKGNTSLKRTLTLCLANAGLPSIELESPHHECSRFYQWLFERCLDESDSDTETKTWLLSAVYETVVKRNIHSHRILQSLTQQLHSLLDSEASLTCGELFAVLRVITYISDTQPSLIAHIFEDIIDILTGWMVDPKQSNDSVDQLAQIMISFHPHWRNVMHTCRHMTGQFIEDIEYHMPLVHSGHDIATRSFQIRKLSLLVRVFDTAVKSAGECFYPTDNGVIEYGYICKCLSRILDSLYKLTTLNPAELSELKLNVNDCIGTLAPCGEDLSSVKNLLKFMFEQVNCLMQDQNSQPTFRRLYTLNMLVMNCDAAELIPLTKHILNMDLTTMKLSDNIHIQSGTLQLYRNWFATKDLETIRSTFMKTKECLEASLAVLSGEAGADWTESRADVVKSKQKARDLLMFHLSSLTQVATDKSSLIWMYSIEPTIFNFLLKDILLGYGESIKGHSTILIHVIRLLHLHCNSNKNFIEKSKLCAADTTRRHRHNITVNSGDNFSLILESMGELFSLTLQNTHGLVLLTRWISEIVQQVASLNPLLLNNILVVTMVTNLLALEDEVLVESIRFNIANTLVTLAQCATLSPALLTVIVDYTLHQLSSDLPSVVEQFLHVATLLPVDSFQRINSKELMKKHSQVLGYRKAIMSGCYGSLGAQQFRSVAALLFKDYTNSNDIDIEWLQRLLLTAEKPSPMLSDQDRSTSPLEQISHHTGLLEYWLLWQAADFCVAHKLRTPIGNPRETFLCIESAIKQIAADNRIEVSPKCGADTKRVWILLQFMENLEKALYNAYEGTAGQITTHGKLVRSFFRTNRGTCIEWLTRIRLHILSIASSYGHPATVVRHGYELITDMHRSQSTQTPEFELVLVYLIEAWCQLNCTEAIQGLYEWCKSVCNRKLPWIKPFFLKASGRLEEAATELKTSLSNMLSPQALGDSIKLQTRPSPAISAVNQLTAQQITDCYASLQSWDDASAWLDDFNKMKSANTILNGVNPEGYTDKILMADHAEQASPELISWSKQQQLTGIWKSLATGSGDHSVLSEEDIKKLKNLVKIECSSDWPASIQPNTMLSLQSQYMAESAMRIDDLSSLNAQPHGLPWLLRLSQLTNEEQVSTDYRQRVLIACCREARNTDNHSLAHSLMAKLSQTRTQNEESPLNLRIEREVAKQMLSKDSFHRALEKMITIALIPVDHEQQREMSELVARSTLTTVKWFQSDSQHMQSWPDSANMESVPSLSKLITNCSKYTNDTPTVPLVDKILGSMLQMSTSQCPSLAKTWYHFGNWAYKWGRKCLDNAEQSLSQEEVEKIESFLPAEVSGQEREDILSVMSMVQGTFSTDEDLAEDSPDYGDDDLQEIRRRLVSCCPMLSAEAIENLLDFWTVTAKRVYTLYEESAKAYFSYLSLSTNTQGSGHHNVTITLRLLRLLVKHAWELREVLESGLATTPTAPWRSIIPQLFSRLNHPELYVRQSVSELLARLADDYPHLIVYPAIVGCNQSARMLGRAFTYVEGADNETETPGGLAVTDGSSGLTDCFQQLVETLSSTNPLLIKQVGILVNELCRITVLWDEFWLGSLNQLSATAAERIKALASEVERVKKNSSLNAVEKKLLIHEKRDTIVKPLIHTIERLSEITGKAPETKHEQWFQETYGQLIKNGLFRLSNPERDEDLLSDWQPFKQLHVTLQQRSQKRSSHMLKMKDLSSVLASLTDTHIPLPGAIAKSDKQPITLQSVYLTVQILPTKTKPKKLAFMGSDGQKYTYLFKGLEDLHLDERIMQLLNIVNDMLVSKGVTDSDCALYRARNYSVTPLGLRSGLIQWVDGCVPLFSLYKRWQVREAAAQSKPNGSTSTVQRPSEVLYSKLLPLLKTLLEDRGLNPKEVKISDVEKIRKDWPQNALVTATKQLIAETPSHLVAKEIWCHSTSTNEWWNTTQTYCRSVAVMSAIGYILGLGDRHLDNLLLDLKNGEIVHIDYNVCFDKGKSLRVPERVPFRLTSNVVAAMGATGVEGIFRSACEHTIKSMRLGKETLLTLLEAFVYDPLVDWTVGGETGLAGAFYGGNYAFGNAAKDYRRRKKQMERDITRSMFSIRVTEMKTAWLQNKEEMSSSLTELVTSLNSYSEESARIVDFNEQVLQCREILKYIEELKKEGGQAISRLTQKFAVNQKMVSARDECLKDVHSMSEELTKYSRLHQGAVEAVTGPQLNDLEREIMSIPQLGETPSSCTRSLMNNVGLGATVDQAEQLHGQLVLLVERRQQQMLQCKQSLMHYGAIVTMFPTELYLSNHIMGECMQLISRLEDDFTYANCEAVLKALDSGSRSFSQALCAKAAVNERALQTVLNSDTAKLEKLVERSEAEKTDISVLIGSYEAKAQAIRDYQRLHDENGRRSIMFITLPKLADIIKKYLLMENTASKAEKRLHSLTSRDGDWFLDELACVTDNLLEYVQMTEYDHQPSLRNAEEDKPKSCTSLLKDIVGGVHKVYTALQDMMLNFQKIILPDILMGLVKGEQSVQLIINSLKNDVIGTHDLGKMCSKLEAMLRNIIFGTKGVDSDVTNSVTELRSAYRRMISAVLYGATMSKSTMLSKAFDGLFGHVYEEYCAAMQGTDKIQIPKAWRKIDVIREAGALQLSQYNEKTKHILADLFFVKQIMAIDEFYKTAEHYVNIFSVAEPATTDSYEALSRPVKLFIADFVRKQILGVASQSAGFLICQHLADIGLDVDKEIALKDFGATSRVSVEDLCKKGLDRKTQTGTQLSQANSLISNFESAWRKQDLAKRLTRNRMLLETLVSQRKRYILCYQWLHEELLSAAATAGQPVHSQPTRKEVLTELHKSLSALVSTNGSFSELIEKMTASESIIAQRLKWAAGANPKHNSVVTQFEHGQTARSSVFQAQSVIVKELTTYCHSLLHLETMRTKSQEATALESKSRQLFNRCLEVCKTLAEDDQITEQQKMMISLMSKADRQKTGNSFLGRAHDSVQSQMSTLSAKIKGLNRSVILLTEKYQAQISSIQYGTLNAHHKLISEVRAVLKTLAKEEIEDPVSLGCRVQDYLRDYKLFSEKLASVIKLTTSENPTEQLRVNITTLVSDLTLDIEGIFTRLVDISKPLAAFVSVQKNAAEEAVEDPVVDGAQVGEAPSTSELEMATTTSPSALAKGPQGHGVQRDPKTGKAVQERNSYAVSVWRRVKMKLDGRELDPNKKMSVTDQVGYVIAEASDIRNLAQMYEGWTSWV